ncbi:DUF177 domain-containing protein [Latilactobacillus graminis]|uniref:DUF177 domain-containing protein n=2 Tax=Latilactobacillus graminis TaxID=60519 RepID=A0AA89I024_9LACO|nr:DUF177 domain-containing protein [Latilactobacillus graminis]KRM21127.1 hypothetical protein FC90_GL001664 [Latilactobacillus graminis DSM 20719]QFP79253.1 DUF177 domain-containing protein [Latilactobacillus graminis]
MLKWAVQSLLKHRDHPLMFKETLMLKESLQKREADILNATPFVVDGELTVDQRAVIARVHVVGALTVPSTRSLEPVDLPMDFEFTEIYVDPEDEQLNRFTDEDILFPFEGEALELQVAIEDHILLHIPSHILTPEEEHDDVMPAGQSWTVISEEAYAKQQADEEITPNPEFAKLKQLLEDQSDDAD